MVPIAERCRMLDARPSYMMRGPRGRRYVFTPLPGGLVLVRRLEAVDGRPVQVKAEEMSLEKARSRAAYLKTFGYKFVRSVI